MYQVIARKYRPQNFGELIGQEHVKTTIENAINQKRIAHGYIFSGQRGTGKTTVARILARCLNCIDGPTPNPCGVCASCLEIPGGHSMDVIEIDAASNRGINEMRELRENVRFRPARDRYKVFIVDEAHQITSEAFNALLKTLEEPPEWVVFILCTTEVHKIPTTIASRCQQFSFRSVDFAELIKRMRWICDEEKIEADEDALAVLAQAGEGSVRDSLSALDQAIACCGGVLTAPQVRTLLGMFSLESLGKVAEALGNSDSQEMLGVVQELESNGHNLQHFCRELARYFRNLLVVRIAGKGTRLVAASAQEQERLFEVASKFSEDDLTRYLQLSLDLFKELQFSLQPRLHIELGLLKLVHAGRLLPIEQAIAMVSSGAALPAPQASRPSAPPPASSPVRSASQPAPRPTARFSVPPPSAPVTPKAPPVATAAPSPQPVAAIATATPTAPAEEGDLQRRLIVALTEMGLAFIADSVAHSNVEAKGGELIFLVGSRADKMAIESDVPKVVMQVLGRNVKVTAKIGTPVNTAPIDLPPPPKKADETEVAERALAHPEVKRFTELFPEAHVRQVRNLKE